MFLSAEKYGQCKTKCDTVSDSVLHFGHIRDCFLLARQVDNTLRSVLNLVYISLMSGFLITFIYSGNWKATDNSRLVVKRLDEEIALCRSYDRLISKVRFSILTRRHHHIESGPLLFDSLQTHNRDLRNPSFRASFELWAAQVEYRQISNISRTEAQNLNVSRLVLQLSLPNLFTPGVKSTMKM